MMLDKLEAAYREADAVRTVLKGHAGETPTVHLKPHVICSTTHEAKVLAIAVAAYLGGEVSEPHFNDVAVGYDLGDDLTISGLYSVPQRDRYAAAVAVEPSRVAAVVLGDE